MAPLLFYYGPLVSVLFLVGMHVPGRRIQHEGAPFFAVVLGLFFFLLFFVFCSGRIPCTPKLMATAAPPSSVRRVGIVGFGALGQYLYKAITSDAAAAAKLQVRMHRVAHTHTHIDTHTHTVAMCMYGTPCGRL